MGRTRHVGVVVPSFLAALPLLEQSDHIAMLPSGCLRSADKRKLVAFTPPVPVEGFTMHMAWHERGDGNLALQHVAELMRGAVAAIRQP